MSAGLHGYPLEITSLLKTGGPLTKRIKLAADGTIVSDGSACVMSRGEARRARFDNLEDFAKHIVGLDSHEAIALGALRNDLPETVHVVTKVKLGSLNGAIADTIARTAEHIAYRPSAPTLALIDFDMKGMPDTVRNAIDAAGGLWASLTQVLPALAAAARVTRQSTSAGLYRTDSDERLSGSGGEHIYVVVRDGDDVVRFLRALHDRCWLAGFGWLMVGTAGQLLERSIVDRMVGAPERLVFEGAPILDAPLAQDRASRAPVVVEGDTLDTLAACPPLSLVEQARLRQRRDGAAHRLAPESARERARFIERQSKRLAERTGIASEDAERIIAQQCEGILLPHIALQFDDEELAGVTVADVIADPARFEGATLADPLEGREYGRCKAMVMRRPDGWPWINSHAHGRTTYELKYDARAVAAAIDKATPDKIVNLFITMMHNASASRDEIEALRNVVAEKSGITKRALSGMLKETRTEDARLRASERRNRLAAERRDPRPQIEAPPPDAPWIPQMQVINDVLGASTAPEPPMRDIEGFVTQVGVRRVPNMHELTPNSSNDEDNPETRLPPPEQPLLSRLDEMQAAEMIEQHIDYVDTAITGRSVHLAPPFVKHFHKRNDGALPTVIAIATLPLMLPNGELLSKRGLDRKRGIVFRVPDELLRLLPDRRDCTPAAVAEAMRFLTDDFLADVLTDYTGKCLIISAALTVIQRAILAERPTFFVTAGQRGGGKTTTLIMLMMAVTGVRPSAAAWSTNEEERRKALLAYFMEALPAIIWDNIPRGTQIACPHIEKSCTSAFYSDRKLGVSELVSVATSAIHFFTGNNIAPLGDLASRSLQIRLEVDRPDPENREFKHNDPIEWTIAHRGRILTALYAVLLGNPSLRPGSNVEARTRFKPWWRLVGSAVENAAMEHLRAYDERVAAMVADRSDCPPVEIDFRNLFIAQEAEEEETANLTEALVALEATQWRQREGRKDGTFQAADLTTLLNDQSDYRLDEEKQRAATLREFLFGDLLRNQDVTAKSVSKRLSRHKGEPVRAGERTLILKASNDRTGTANFWIEKRT